jgi:hypothetical protein
MPMPRFEDKNKTEATRVSDFFEPNDEFGELLDAAVSSAEDKGDLGTIAFANGMQERYAQYGKDTFLSKAQLSWLRALASGD